MTHYTKSPNRTLKHGDTFEFNYNNSKSRYLVDYVSFSTPGQYFSHIREGLNLFENPVFVSLFKLNIGIDNCKNYFCGNHIATTSQINFTKLVRHMYKTVDELNKDIQISKKTRYHYQLNLEIKSTNKAEIIEELNAIIEDVKNSHSTAFGGDSGTCFVDGILKIN